MKTLVTALTITLIALSNNASANPYGSANQGHMNMIQKLQNMTPEQQAEFMQNMQAGAMQAQACMGNIDQGALQALQTRGEAMSAKIDALCAQGKAKEAEAYAMAEGKKIMNDPTVKKMQACSKDAIKNIEALYGGGDIQGEKGSICDQ